MRLAKRDVNHAEIRDALRKAGFRVLDVAGYAGLGCDLMTEARDGRVVLLEVKRPGPPSARRLTDSEKALMALFPTSFFVVQSVEEALRACGIDVIPVAVPPLP